MAKTSKKAGTKTAKKTETVEVFENDINVDDVLNEAILESKDFVHEKPEEKKIEESKVDETEVETPITDEKEVIEDAPAARLEPKETEAAEDKIIEDIAEDKNEAEETEVEVKDDHAVGEMKVVESKKKRPWYIERAMNYTYGDYGFTN